MIEIVNWVIALLEYLIKEFCLDIRDITIFLEKNHILTAIVDGLELLGIKFIDLLKWVFTKEEIIDHATVV